MYELYFNLASFILKYSKCTLTFFLNLFCKAKECVYICRVNKNKKDMETIIKYAVKYSDTRGGLRREWTVPCEILKETKGGTIKVKEFRDGAELIKYVPKSKLIKL